MYSCPCDTSTGTMWPGSLVANATSPVAPTARYSVMKIDPPPATRFNTPKSPPPPANWLWVVIWIELPIHDSSPASEMTDSLGSRANSSTGMVVPVTRLCIGKSPRGRVYKVKHPGRRHALHGTQCGKKNRKSDSGSCADRRAHGNCL